MVIDLIGLGILKILLINFCKQLWVMDLFRGYCCAQKMYTKYNSIFKNLNYF